MWPNSFGRTILIILFIIVGLILIIVGLRVYGQYWKRPTAVPVVNLANTNSTNTNSPNGYIPTVDDDPSMGAVQPKVTIIAFEDFQCPYCRESAPIMQQLLQEYPNDVQYVFRDFPLYTIHPQALIAAQAAECADEQNQFWPWHHLVYDQAEELVDENKAFLAWAEELGLDMTTFTSCLEQAEYQTEVEKDLNSGVLAGVTSTPTFFVNGHMIEGVLTLDQWRQVVNELL